MRLRRNSSSQAATFFLRRIESLLGALRIRLWAICFMVVKLAGACSVRTLRRDNTALGCAFANYNETLLGSVAEISVDRATGWIKVHNYWATIDCGIPVQPDNIVRQMQGGIVFGLGLALTEEITIRDGLVQQSNFYDYRVSRMNDVPEIYVEVMAPDNSPSGVGK